MAAHHQVNAGGLGRKVRRHIPVGVADHHHQVAVLPLQLFLPVLRPLPDVAVLRVVPVGKVHALAVGGGQPLRPVDGPQAQHAHAHRPAAHLCGEDGIALGGRLLALPVQIVAGENPDGGGLLLLGGKCVKEPVPDVGAQAELIQAGHQHVVADGAQGQGLGLPAVLEQAVVHRVAAVQQQGGVHLFPLLFHGGGHVLIARRHPLTGQGILPVHPAGHVAGGVDGQDRAPGLRLPGGLRRGRGHRRGQQGRAQQRRPNRFEKMPLPRHSNRLISPRMGKIFSWAL